MGILNLYIKYKSYLGFCFGIGLEIKESFDSQAIINKAGFIYEDKYDDKKKMILSYNKHSRKRRSIFIY